MATRGIRIFMTISIAVVYVVLTFLSRALGLSIGGVEMRVSEVLCILPMFTALAVPGLGIGCAVANLAVGCAPVDILFGTIATLIGAVGTSRCRFNRWIAPIFPVISNMIIVPIILKCVYNYKQNYILLVILVGLGEFLCAYVLGQLWYNILIKDHEIED